MYIQNQIYKMDNLTLLNKIENNTINLIYCDILYGTGKDFGAYKDIKSDFKIIENFYFKRLEEMKRVLTSNGSIVLQMDKRINHWIRLFLDDIFGYENFRNEITWCYSGGGVSKKSYPAKSDVIIWYSKSDQYI